MSSFQTLGLIDPVQRAVAGAGYEIPTPIQSQAIPHLLAGRDVLGCAQTGTGKTAAFALPILDRLARTPRRAGARGPRALVLTPTRELALQINEGFSTYGRHVAPKCAVIFGGVGQAPQVEALRRDTDIIVATPGRLIDLMEQGHARLEAVEMLVLDEADRMLDMGFIEPIRRIVGALPRRRQNLMFSATMPEEIRNLARKILVDPVEVSVTPVSSTAEKVRQWVLHVERGNKRALLKEVLRDPAMTRVLVFTRTKHGANRVAEDLDKKGVPSAAIHGNKSQNARQRALDAFKTGRIRVLVATDIAARGIDVDGVTHVINFELPDEPESYVHRIGRTARAGASGVALSFCDAEERASLRDIERLIRAQVPVVSDHPFVGVPAPVEAQRERGPSDRPPHRGPGGGGRGGRGGRGRSFSRRAN
ncbi:MAG TPA: DEAD/DEAH box helicase [Polyangia bacterium]|jgi:ATP-dependent RNA helicase RhlE|nr:DEAD/DEAH box helicase [Polyangia bacterium]